MKILVTGARGLLGSEFVRVAPTLGFRCVGLGREQMDVTDANAVLTGIYDRRPDWVIHCAAYTDVDGAESHQEEAMAVNRDGTANVARAAEAAGARLVYVSSDYVFDGRSHEPYETSDVPAPISAYGRSKLAGEEVASRSGQGNALIVRTGWLYGAGGRGFLDVILDGGRRSEPLRVVDDQRARPTWAKNAAETVLLLMGRGVRGVWHVADGGEATRLEFAREALRLRGRTDRVEGISSDEWGAAAPRPHYSVLALRATEAAVGHLMMDWREALRLFLHEAAVDVR